MSTNLLDTLAEMTGCSYLSDLLLTDNASWKQILNQIPSGKYPLKQWDDAVRYLSGNHDITLETEEEARDYLCYIAPNISNTHSDK